MVRHELPLPRTGARAGAGVPRCAPTTGSSRSREAAALGIPTRPVVLGPVTFLLLSKGLERPLDALASLVPVYAELLRALVAAGAREVQIDEPCLALDRTPAELGAICEALSRAGGRGRRGAEPRDLLRRRSGRRSTRCSRCRWPSSTSTSCGRRSSSSRALAALDDGAARLSLGVVDGRNVWVTDLDAVLRVGRPRGRRARRRARDDRAVVLAAPRALRGGARDGLDAGDPAVARVRGREAGGAARAGCAPPRDPRLRAARRPATRSRHGARPRAPTTRRCASGSPRSGRPTTSGRRRPTTGASAQRGAPPAARAPDHDDRLVPADRGDPCGAPRAARRHVDAGGVRRVPRASGSRRRSSSRSGSASTCWCTASPSATTWSSTSAEQLDGFAFSDARLGAVLRLPLRQAADPVRRRLAAGADDRALVAGTPSRSPTGR